MRYRSTAFILFVLALLTFSEGCSDKSVPVNTNPLPDPNITVSVAPKTTALGVGESTTLSAIVSGSSNKKVEWAVFSNASAFGFISQDGVYTAPSAITGDSIVVYAEATSMANPDKADTAIIVVKQTVVHTVPKIGSTYTFNSLSKDSTGNIISGSDTSLQTRVILGGLNYKGKTGVVGVFLDNDTSYFNYDANGDLWQAVKQGPWTKADWIKLPAGTKESSTVITDDNTTNGVHYSRTVTTSYIASGTMTIGGQDILTQKIHVRTIETKNGLEAYTLATDDDYWFAPALGWFVKVDENSEYTGKDMHMIGGFSNTLTGYELK